MPLALFGHSWGSLLAQKIIDDHSEDYDAVVLSGTAYRTLLHMNGGDLNKKHAHLGSTGFEWLSRDEAVSLAFQSDALTSGTNAMKLFGLLDSVRLLGRPKKGPAA